MTISLSSAERRALLDAYIAGRDAPVESRTYRTTSNLWLRGLIDAEHRIKIQGMRAEPLLAHELGALHAAALDENLPDGDTSRDVLRDLYALRQTARTNHAHALLDSIEAWIRAHA